MPPPRPTRPQPSKLFNKVALVNKPFRKIAKTIISQTSGNFYRADLQHGEAAATNLVCTAPIAAWRELCRAESYPVQRCGCWEPLRAESWPVQRSGRRDPCRAGIRAVQELCASRGLRRYSCAVQGAGPVTERCRRPDCCEPS